MCARVRQIQEWMVIVESTSTHNLIIIGISNKDDVTGFYREDERTMREGRILLPALFAL